MRCLAWFYPTPILRFLHRLALFCNFVSHKNSETLHPGVYLHTFTRYYVSTSSIFAPLLTEKMHANQIQVLAPPPRKFAALTDHIVSNYLLAWIPPFFCRVNNAPPCTLRNLPMSNHVNKQCLSESVSTSLEWMNRSLDQESPVGWVVPLNQQAGLTGNISIQHRPTHLRLTARSRRWSFPENLLFIPIAHNEKGYEGKQSKDPGTDVEHTVQNRQSSGTLMGQCKKGSLHEVGPNVAWNCYR